MGLGVRGVVGSGLGWCGGGGCSDGVDVLVGGRDEGGGGPGGRYSEGGSSAVACDDAGYVP